MRGFTLIELLVVLLILALAAFVAVLAAPPLKSDARVAAETFSASLSAAHDAAALSGAPTRIVIEERAYAIERYVSPEWRPLSVGRRPARIKSPQGVAFTLEAQSLYQDNDEKNRRRRDNEQDARRFVVIDPAGFPVVLRADFDGGRRERWRVRQTAEGTVSVERY
ncbi:MAG: prepilin-type N-terminal cleavage/methylation domain-containing protein [Pseudomonadota bacterium]